MKPLLCLLRLIVPLAALALVGCVSTSKPRIVVPPHATGVHGATVAAQQSTAKARRSALSASTEVSSARGSIERAKQGVGAAAEGAEKLLLRAAPELLPALEELRANLAVSDRELEQARLRAVSAEENLKAAVLSNEEVDTQLAEIHKRAEELQAEINAQSARLAEESAARLAAETKVAKLKMDEANQRELAWKWRIRCLVGGGVALLIVFRRPIGALCGLPIP